MTDLPVYLAPADTPQGDVYWIAVTTCKICGEQIGGGQGPGPRDRPQRTDMVAPLLWARRMEHLRRHWLRRFLGLPFAGSETQWFRECRHGERSRIEDAHSCARCVEEWTP